jgi:hypothetical protein
MKRPHALCAALLLAAVAAAPARAQDSYYMAVFGYQRPPLDLAKHAHSFAAFVHVTGEGGPGGPCLAETFAISWLPDGRPVRVRRLLPELGRNYDLGTTLCMALAQGERVSMWGPYRIDPDLYARALAQRERLESGEVRYKAVDSGYRAARVSNCMHAVSDLAGEERRLRIASPGWGEPASYLIARELLPWVIDPGQTHDWVAEALGLGAYPIVRRDLADPPPCGALRQALLAIRHRSLLRHQPAAGAGRP